MPFANRAPLDDEGRCPLCRLGLLGFDAAYCCSSYEGVARELIQLLKYGRIATLAGPMGQRLATSLPRDQRFDAIVPVPLHWRRRWQRGFNQSELLAREIARRSAIPVLNALKRVRATDPQVGLSNSRRRSNVAGAFVVKSVQAISGKRILLVDDVMTTGATASACAAALKKGGAAHVAVLTLARVDRRWNSLAVPGVTRDGTAITGAS
jgi:ComF family protein